MTEEVRTTSETGGEKGVKEARYDLIPVEALEQVAVLYGRGAAKYAEHNWRRGYEWSKSYAALQRHANAFWRGEDVDAEMRLPHLASVVFHALALMTFMEEQKGFDDRFGVDPLGQDFDVTFKCEVEEPRAAHIIVQEALAATEARYQQLLNKFREMSVSPAEQREFAELTVKLGKNVSPQTLKKDFTEEDLMRNRAVISIPVFVDDEEFECFTPNELSLFTADELREYSILTEQPYAQLSRSQQMLLGTFRQRRNTLARNTRVIMTPVTSERKHHV